jgi:phospholipid/cholesterol/gamma-HCH transport system substrate-binding protein
MEGHSTLFKVRLGLFIIIGMSIFVAAVFIIGRQRNLFVPVYKLTTTFHNVSGLQVGNNIRFSGINVGTVDKIMIINDSTVRVEMMIQRNVKPFIKTDCEAFIGTAGIIGDKILMITRGSSEAPSAAEGQYIYSKEPVETDAIMSSLEVTANNAAIITNQLSEIMFKVNSGHGVLGRLIQDSSIADNLNQTMINLKKSSKGLDENMNAAKQNFLLRGYFKRKEREAEKLKTDSAAQKSEKSTSNKKKK